MVVMDTAAPMVMESALVAVLALASVAVTVKL